MERIGNWNQADGGVDLFAVRKLVNAVELKLAIQCKRSKNEIQPKVIRELNGVLSKNHAHAGVVATTSYFTQATKEEAKNYHWQISLQNRDDIIDRMKVLLK